MIKKNLKTMILGSIIILVPMVVGLMMWDMLPAEMATHFGENGEPDGWSSKPFVVFGFPIILLAVHWFCAFFTSVDPKNKNISDKMATLVFWIAPVISLLGCGSTYLYAMDNTINNTRLGMMIMGCIFLVIGNYMPKMKQSYTIGIKLPWTLESEENWNRTHRVGGYTFMIAGGVCLIAGFLQIFWISFVVLIGAALVPYVYSYSLYKKGI